MNTADVKAFFDRVASDWDTMRIAYYDERVIERLGDFAGLTPDMVIADVGTGTGFVAAGIAPRVAKVIGIDISERILEVARRNLDELAIANVRRGRAPVGVDARGARRHLARIRPGAGSGVLRSGRPRVAHARGAGPSVKRAVHDFGRSRQDRRVRCRRPRAG
jgi:SAM-dependent methyltransferase